MPTAYIKSLRDRYTPDGSFRQHVLTMFSGTVVAQTILILTAPVLTRLYLPSSFGTFDALMAIVSLVAIAATARYDIAIILPEQNKDAASLAWLAALLALCMGIFSSGLIFAFGPQLRAMLDRTSISAASPWLCLVGPAAFAMAFYQIMNCWSVRLTLFKDVALGKVIQSLSFVLIALVSGLFVPGPGGLIAAQIIGPFLAVLFLASRPGSIVRMPESAARKKLSTQARRYYRFPLFSLPADFINTAATQLPYLMIASIFGSAALGLFTLPNRVLGAPISLLAASLLDVFKRRASSDYAKHGNCIDIYKKTFKTLVLLGLAPFLLTFLLAPVLFPIIFGAQWAQAGVYARLLSFMFYCRFVASPLSYVLYIAEKQNYDLIWQASLLVLVCASILGGAHLGDAKTAVLLFSAAYSVMYLVYMIMSYNFAKGTNHRRPDEIR